MLGCARRNSLPNKEGLPRKTREKNKFDISRIVFPLLKDGCSSLSRAGKFCQ